MSTFTVNNKELFDAIIEILRLAGNKNRDYFKTTNLIMTEVAKWHSKIKLNPLGKRIILKESRLRYKKIVDAMRDKKYLGTYVSQRDGSFIELSDFINDIEEGI